MVYVRSTTIKITERKKIIKNVSGTIPSQLVRFRINYLFYHILFHHQLKNKNCMKKYFLHNGTEQQGPFNLDELSRKKLTKQTPIWYDGLPQWTLACEVEELKVMFLSSPPPFSNNLRSGVLDSQSSTQYLAVKEKGKTKQAVFITIGFLVLISGIIFAVNLNSVNSESSGGSYQQKIMTIEQTELSQPATFLTADGTYNQNFWGDKFKVHGTIKNTATVATFKDAVVRVTYYSKTKTVLASNKYTIYERFAPGSTSKFELKIDNYKDVDSIGWDVLSASAN
jgi:hypothetical protein